MAVLTNLVQGGGVVHIGRGFIMYSAAKLLTKPLAISPPENHNSHQLQNKEGSRKQNWKEPIKSWRKNSSKISFCYDVSLRRCEKLFSDDETSVAGGVDQLIDDL